MQFRQLKRREFVTLLGGAAAAWPLPARAQQAGRTYKLAVLSANPREAPQYVALLEELRRQGFIEAQNMAIRGFALRGELLREFAIEAVKEGVDAILCGGGAATRAAQEATRTVPIIAVTDDMVVEGLVGCFAQMKGCLLESISQVLRSLQSLDPFTLTESAD
jgi:putative tryptophan/tyrosine transport system substrate-binding protein